MPKHLKDSFEEGWSIVSYPIESPVCDQVEGYFGLAFENLQNIPEAVTFLKASPVRILMRRQEVYRRVTMVLDLYLKKYRVFGRSNALVTGSPLQGWVVASNPMQSGFMLARRTAVDLNSQDFDRIKRQYSVHPIHEIPHVAEREAWLSEFGSYCNGNAPSNGGRNFLDGVELLLP